MFFYVETVVITKNTTECADTEENAEKERFLYYQ